MSESETTSYAQGNIETGVGATMIALGIVVVALRFYARIHLQNGLGWDDWLALVGLIATIIPSLLVLSGQFVSTSIYSTQVFT